MKAFSDLTGRGGWHQHFTWEFGKEYYPNIYFHFFPCPFQLAKYSNAREHDDFESN
jgi:hypothetical protein